MDVWPVYFRCGPILPGEVPLESYPFFLGPNPQRTTPRVDHPEIPRTEVQVQGLELTFHQGPLVHRRRHRLEVQPVPPLLKALLTRQ